MLEKFKYINHMGEVLEIGGGSLFANESDLRNFEWEVVSKNDKISGFKKGIVSKAIPLIIKCDTAEKGFEMRNKIYELAEKDVLANKSGKIYVGDYYLKCFIVGNTKSEYLISKQYMRLELIIQTDASNWIKETVYPFRMGKAADGENYLDFPHDMPFDYRNSLAIRSLNNTAFAPSNFRLLIYGACVNPVVFIGDQEYSVNVTVEQSEYLTIDSVNKTIYLTKNNGEIVNCYNLRNREAYIFEKIKPGNNVVTTTNDGLNFDVTLLEERSEPKWT